MAGGTMSQWVRLWDGMPNDPKWRVIARRSGRPVSEVLSVFIHMMMNAKEWEHRGEIENWSDEDVAAAIDADPEHVLAIREAMQGKTLDGNHLTGWEKRQSKTSDESAGRVAKWREKKRAGDARNEPVTACNASNGRREEKREDKIDLSKDKSTRGDALSLTNEFEKTFWPLYPHKIGKGVAKRSFKAARRRVELQPLMDGLVAYMRTKPAGREWCNPSTWLNQDRWLDRPAEANAPVPQSLSMVTKSYFVPKDSDAGRVWWEHRFQTTGKYPPTDKNGGWHFPSEWPPKIQEAAE